MRISYILLQQILFMFVLAAIGYLLFRKRKITTEGSKSIANILIYLSLPCVIIKGFLVERTTENFMGFIISTASAAVILILSIIISHLIFKKDPIAEFAGAFSNPGFFGIPIITACINENAVFYIAAFIAFLNLLQWSYGVSIMTGKGGSLSFKKIITAPFMIAIIIGLFFYFSGLQVPSIMQSSIVALANLNTPLAMFTTGIYLAQTDLMKTFTNLVLYRISFVRLLVIPFFSFLLLSIIPSAYTDLKIALLIAAACPVGANVAVYAQLHDKNYSYAVETIVLSTLFSSITMPFIIQIIQQIWLS